MEKVCDKQNHVALLKNKLYDVRERGGLVVERGTPNG